MTLAIEMKGITVTFPGVIANDKIDFYLKKGEEKVRVIFFVIIIILGIKTALF